jgi:hypothetical protein
VIVAPVQVIVDVPALKVRLVVDKLIGVLPPQVTVEEPKFIVATPVVDERCKLAPKVTLKFPVLKVPASGLR